MNPDAVVVELIADVKGLTPITNKAADDFDKAVKRISNSADQAGVSVERMAARTANGTRNLGRQISDVGTQLSGGQNPFLIIAQQAPQVADALTDMGGAAGRAGALISGPLGASLLAVGSVLAIYISKLFEGKDATGKLHQGSLTLVEALTKEKFATQAAQKALDDYNESKKKANEADVFATEQARKEAIARLQGALATRQLLKAEIDRALVAEGQSRGLGGGQLLGLIGPTNELISQEDAKIKRLVTTLKELQNTESDQLSDIATDRTKYLNAVYDRAVEREKELATATERGNGTMARRVQRINEMRDAALKANREEEAAANRKGSPSANDQIGKQITVAEATSIVESVGGRVTSGLRSRGKQAQLYEKYLNGTGSLAAPPGSSLHEIGQAVDVAKSAGVTIAKLKRAFEAEGVRITELLDEGDHYHVGFGKKTSAQAADDAARALEKTRETNVRFTNEVVANAQKIQGLFGKGADDRAKEQWQSVFGKEDPLKDSLDTIGPAMRGRTDLWDEENQRRQRIQEKQIGELANLYEGLFTGGVKGIWDEFKREGLRTLALLLAKWTVAAFTKQADGGTLSGLLTSLGSAATSMFGGGGGGGVNGSGVLMDSPFAGARASGGPVEAGRLYQINEGASGGRVEGFMPSTGGKVIPLGSMGAASGSRSSITQNHYAITVRADNSVTPAGFASGLAQQILAEARRMDERTLDSAPARVQRMNTLGS